MHDHVLGLVARRVRSLEDAEDITQEVMLRHAPPRRRARARRARGARGCIVSRSTRSQTTTAARPVASCRPARSSTAGNRSSTSRLTPSGDELRRELAACLTPLIERLRPIYRQALELTELDGLSQVEAAAPLGLSVSGMKARVQRARQQLREELLACCEVELDRRRRVTGVRSRGVACGTCGQR